MRTILLLASVALTWAAVITGPATADDRLHLTPPLYREQARATQQTRSTADLTTVPQPVPAASTTGDGKALAADKVVVEASAR